MSLALATLLYEWRRYMAAVMALALSGLLVLAMTGVFIGIGKGFTAQIERSSADIIVMQPGAKTLFGGPSGVPRRYIPQVYNHPAVEEVQPFDMAGGTFQSVRDVDPTMSQADTVAIDETTLPKLGVKLGDKALYNGQTVTVAAVLSGYPSMMQPAIVMSRDTLRRVGQADDGPRVGPLMVKLADGSQPEIVSAQINAMGKGQWKAWTRDELAEANAGAMFEEGILVIIIGGCVVLGTIIGVAITWQTLRGAIMANIKEFASLRALGVSMGSLRRIVLELSFWVGCVGVVAAITLTWLIGLLASANAVIIALPPILLIIVGGGLIAIAMLSGLLSLGILRKSQPADLLR